MRNIVIQEHIDNTVTVRFIGGQYLRRMTPRSELTLTDQPFYWGNFNKAVSELSAYMKLKDQS